MQKADNRTIPANKLHIANIADERYFFMSII
jgi:hypothetical protein